MPTIVNDGNMFMDWSNDQSVMDPLYETLMKKAVSGVGELMGAGDPASEVANLINPMGVAASPLVTIYKNKAARIPETARFIENARKLGGEKLEEAAKWFAERWPRVAAHKDLITDTEKIIPGAPDAWAEPMHGKPTQKVPVRFSGKGLERAKNDVNFGQDVFAHEGTHVAQNLGNNRMAELYSAVDELGQYPNIPFETTAYDRGASAAKGLRKVEPRMMMPERSYSQMQNDLSNKFRDMGYSLDITYSGGSKPREVRVRKWGSDSSNPANYINPTTLDLPKDMAHNFSLLEEGIDAYNKAGLRRSTSTRELVDMVKKAKDPQRYPARHSYQRDDALKRIEDILLERGMMDK